jgi:hypothetical protein
MRTLYACVYVFIFMGGPVRTRWRAPCNAVENLRLSLNTATRPCVHKVRNVCVCVCVCVYTFPRHDNMCVWRVLNALVYGTRYSIRKLRVLIVPRKKKLKQRPSINALKSRGTLEVRPGDYRYLQGSSYDLPVLKRFRIKKEVSGVAQFRTERWPSVKFLCDGLPSTGRETRGTRREKVLSKTR